MFRPSVRLTKVRSWLTIRVATQERWLVSLRVGSLLLVAVLMIRLAWIGDDALITLRTALNVSHGWGVGFNPVERVQAYTHPLWFLTWILVGNVSGVWLTGVLIFSVVAACGAVALVLWHCKNRTAIVVSVGLLVGSNAFMEYATSGLENPLGYLSIGLYFWLLHGIWFRKRDLSVSLCVLVGLAAGAVVLTRFDLVLLVIVPSALLFYRYRTYWLQLIALLGSMLAVVSSWGAWSWVTYSTVLPNTFFAKRNVEIPLLDLIDQGVFYITFSSLWDPVSLLALTGAATLAFWKGSSFQRAWALSVCIYLAYVISNGGDFMAGRFLAVPVYVAVTILISQQEQWGIILRLLKSRLLPTRVPSSVRLGVVLTFLIIIVFGVAGTNRMPTAISAPNQERWDYQNVEYSRGIADERGVWVGWADRSIWNLSSAYEEQNWPTSLAEVDVTAPLAALEASASSWPSRSGKPLAPEYVDSAPVVIGTWGIQLGPTFHIVDLAALADPYLARQPFRSSGRDWRIGHFFRPMPEGYLKAILTGDPRQVSDPKVSQELADLWRSVRMQ